MDTGMSDDEVKTLADLLAKLKPGFLPPAIFYQIARLTITPVIVIVPLYYKLGEIDVLLLKRDQNDPIWPGKLHVPRTVVRPTDDAASPFVRILSEELANTKTSQPVFVKNILQNSGRGVEATQVYCVAVGGQPTVGEFYDVKKLPPNLMEHLSIIISAAVETFLATR